MICYVVFVFSILLSVTGRGVGATAAYDPTDIFLINCGEVSLTIDSGGRTWTQEGKIISSNSDNASFTSHTLYRESENLQVPFMNARIFRSDFTYSFPISPGWKFIRLYFYPTRYYAYDFDSFNSFFSVNVNGFKNFSAVLTANASIPESKSLIKEFIVPVNKTLNLTFTPSKNSLAFVNGVEINSMPDQFYSKGGFDNMISNVGSTVDFSIDNSTAFETVYRLNVDGQMVADVGDSGMFI